MILLKRMKKAIEAEMIQRQGSQPCRDYDHDVDYDEGAVETVVIVILILIIVLLVVTTLLVCSIDLDMV